MKYCLSVLSEIDSRLAGAARILVATDFDGTLCPIVETPSEARLAPATIEILRHVMACPQLTLAVISGRALADVRRRLPFDIVVAGNHGLELAGGGLDFEHAGARDLRPMLARACEALTALLRDWPAAWIEDKGLSATLHFRKVDPRNHNPLLFAARRALGGFGKQLALRAGKMALEVRPRVSWDKGSALGYIRENAGPFDACICLGDDQTDESMFRANPGGVNIRIGCSIGTAASHYLAGPNEVAILLSHIVDVHGSEARVPRTNPRASAHAATTGFPSLGAVAVSD
ncbi:MAG TPA: trehalose-phosphatase [Bryobacteraceae bacterium]|nr:trehalose-phosphatase [Bryobacteraceae bacterium]